MEKLTIAQKKVANNELRAKLIIEANNLIKDSGLKKITLKKMRAEIETLNKLLCIVLYIIYYRYYFFK